MNENKEIKKKENKWIFFVAFLTFIVFFSTAFITTYLNHKELQNEVDKVDPTIPDGLITILVQDKTKAVANKKMEYVISIESKDIPWDGYDKEASLIKVTKEEYEAFEIGQSYQIEYRESVNRLDDYPNIISIEKASSVTTE